LIEIALAVQSARNDLQPSLDSAKHHTLLRYVITYEAGGLCRAVGANHHAALMPVTPTEKSVAKQLEENYGEQ